MRAGKNPTSFNVKPEFKELLRNVSFAEHRSQTDILNEALGVYFDRRDELGSAAKSEQTTNKGTPQAARNSDITYKSAGKGDAEATFGIPRDDWHTMLDRVLDSKANHLVMAIVTNLLAFGRDAESISKSKPPEKYERYEKRVLSALSELMASDNETTPQSADEKKYTAALLRAMRTGKTKGILPALEEWTGDPGPQPEIRQPAEKKKPPVEPQTHKRKAG